MTIRIAHAHHLAQRAKPEIFIEYTHIVAVTTNLKRRRKNIQDLITYQLGF
jgi:hypothetical protein